MRLFTLLLDFLVEFMYDCFAKSNVDSADRYLVNDFMECHLSKKKIGEAAKKKTYS